MVVERKIIQSPRFLHGHSHWHRLADYLVAALASNFDEPHSLVVNSECLQGLSKNDVSRIGERIVHEIRAGGKSGLASLKSGAALPWRIHPGLFSAPPGVRIEVLDWPGESWPDPADLARIRKAQIAGFRNELQNRLGNVERKFRDFPDHYRVLLLQFVGESSVFIEETDLAPIVEVAQEAGFVDEVWIATKEWISEDDYEILWVPAPNGT